MIVLITLTTAGEDTGPFDLYSDLDGYVLPFEINVSKDDLLAGYTSILVYDGTTIIKLTSTGEICTNSVYITINTIPTTTTSTTLEYLYLVQECETGITYSIPKTFIFSIGDVIQFQITFPMAHEEIICGTIIADDAIGLPTGNLYSARIVECGTKEDCNVLPS